MLWRLAVRDRSSENRSRRLICLHLGQRKAVQSFTLDDCKETIIRLSYELVSRLEMIEQKRDGWDLKIRKIRGDAEAARNKTKYGLFLH